jgi:CDP-glucose 4,6-dehydratase
VEDLVNSAPFWRGRRVFLTGHTGFKGSWLALWLADMGAEVTGYSLPPPTRPSLFDMAKVEDLVRHIEGDVRNEDALTAAAAAARPEVVIHMAAQSLVRLSYDEPVATYATNVMGTVHLLEAVRRVGGAKAVVCVTSDKCYENRETDRPYRETDAMGGYDPYSSSKGCAELVASAYRRSFFHPEHLACHGVGLATARAGNVIGGGDWAKDRLIPDLLNAFAAGARPEVRFPASIRPWQHVLEPLGGYLLLAERLWHGDAATAEGWNFGPSDEDARPVGWVADRLAELWGDDARWDHTGDAQPHEAASLKLDWSKARVNLGWRPAWTLEETLGRTVAWHRAFAAGGDARALTLEQIRGYGTPVHAAFSQGSPGRAAVPIGAKERLT